MQSHLRLEFLLNLVGVKYVYLANVIVLDDIAMSFLNAVAVLVQVNINFDLALLP